MQMEKGLDTGPVLLAQAHRDRRRTETGGQLHDRLAELGAQVLSDGLGLLRAGMRLPPQPQPAEGVTYAHKLDKAKRSSTGRSRRRCWRDKVRAFNPWPIAEAAAGRRARAHPCRASRCDETHAAAPGSVLRAGRDGIDIACGEGVLRLRALQRDGGKPITAADYLNARRDCGRVTAHGVATRVAAARAPATRCCTAAAR